MALTTMKELLVTAQKEKYAVGAFEFWSLESAQAIIHAAETENVPVILQAGKIECDFCFQFRQRLQPAAAFFPGFPVIRRHGK